MSEAVLHKVTGMVTRVLQAKGISNPHVEAGQPLYEDGLGLDSLDTATLAAMLENEFKTDPYNAGEFPETVAEIVSFYSNRAHVGN